MQKIVAPHEGEPVFVLRAEDNAAVDALWSYVVSCRKIGAGEEHIKEVRNVLYEFELWRQANPALCKVPD